MKNGHFGPKRQYYEATNLPQSHPTYMLFTIYFYPFEQLKIRGFLKQGFFLFLGIEPNPLASLNSNRHSCCLWHS